MRAARPRHGAGFISPNTCASLLQAWRCSGDDRTPSALQLTCNATLQISSPRNVKHGNTRLCTVVAVQVFQIASNRVPQLPPAPLPHGVQIADVAWVNGSRQSNGWDCGCHCIMNLRALAEHAQQQIAWRELQLQTECSVSRDAAWRAQVAEECLALQILLTGQSADAPAAAAVAVQGQAAAAPLVLD